MKRRSTAWTPILVLAAAGLLACGGGDAGGTDGAGAEGQAAGQMEEAGGPAAGEATSTEVSLAPRNESGIRGTATLRHGADTVDVTVRLTGLDSASSYPAHVHSGSCAEGGGVAVGLNAVSSRDSTGMSRTRIPASKLEMEGSYFVQAHLPDGTPAACGDLPGMGGASGGAGSSGGGSG